MGTLDGKNALVTGGARGIGRAIALRFAREGANVAVADVNGEGARSVAAEIEAAGRKSLAIEVDLRNLAQIRTMIDRVVGAFGRLDVLANNAGVVRVEKLLDVTEEHWDFVMDVNAKAVFFVMQAAARQMRDQERGPDGLRGRIINTASIAAKPGGRPMFAPYGASKAAVLSLTQSAAIALAPEITVNCVCPGIVDTAMWAQIDVEWNELEGLQEGESWRRRVAAIPMGRTGCSLYHRPAIHRRWRIHARLTFNTAPTPYHHRDITRSLATRSRVSYSGTAATNAAMMQPSRLSWQRVWLATLCGRAR